LTYFEFGTLAALELFRNAAIDVAVLEVGLGGRLDAVNIVDADAALVVSIDIDHIEWLGPDRDSIGYEKAGIYRPGRPAICADADPPARLLDYAQNLGARLHRIGRDYGFARTGQTWRWWSEDAELDELPPPALAGEHQFGNAAAAIATLLSLRHRLPIQLDAIRAGLSEVRLPGRFQTIPGPVEWILDVAHNPRAAAVLADNLRKRPRTGRTSAIIGLLADKDALVGRQGRQWRDPGIGRHRRRMVYGHARRAARTRRSRSGRSAADCCWRAGDRLRQRTRCLPGRSNRCPPRRSYRRAWLVSCGRAGVGRSTVDFRFPPAALTGGLTLDSRLTQRLVGAAVIAALAVIFVPEMLEKPDKSAAAIAPDDRSPAPQPKPAQPTLTCPANPNVFFATSTGASARRHDPTAGRGTQLTAPLIGRRA